MRRRRSRHYEHLPQDFRSPAQQEQQEQATATVQHPVLQMQRQFGNQAVGQLLQRQQDFILGEQVGQYALTANEQVNFAKQEGLRPDLVPSTTGEVKLVNRKGNVLDLMAGIVAETLEKLGSWGIPKPKYIGGADIPSGMKGQFRKNTWELMVNPKIVGEDPHRLVESLQPGELKTLVSEIIEVVYHEARHAEQYYKMAQFVAGKGAEPESIAKQLDIHPDVAKEAHANPIHRPTLLLGLEGLNVGTVPFISAEYIALERWYNAAFGEYGAYTQGIYDILQGYMKFSDLNKTLDEADTPQTRQGMQEIINNWQTTTIPKGLKAIRDNINNSIFRFTYDEKILGYITAILPVLEATVEAWNNEASIPQIKRFLVQHIIPLKSLVEPAYEAVLLEEDAHHIGEKAASTYQMLG
jgi:hypothetical protein